MPKPHALIVEDELIVALDLQDMLTEHGYGSFSFAAASSQALEQCRLRPPDLITMDVGLIYGNGPDTARLLGEICGETPILYITGDASALRDQPDALVLEKPVTRRDLAAALKRLGKVGHYASLGEP
ncbi:MAG: response regulator [Caulobacteraceae bacterium]